MSTALVVEHMPLYLEAMSRILHEEGLEVLSCGTGEEALALLALHSVDLLLLDATVPGLDCLTILTTLRKSQRWQQLPVILLAEVASKTHVRSAAMVGVQGYLLRSHISTGLLPRVRTILQSLKAPAQSTPGPHNNPHSSVGDLDAASPSARKDVQVEQEAHRIAAQVIRTRPMDPDAVLVRVRRQLELRSVPPVLQHVMALTGSSRTTIDEVVGAVRQDQALALKVMKVANSSFYTTGKRAQSLTEATQRIGLSGIRNAAAAILAIDHFGEISAGGLVPQHFWEHSLATGLLTQLLAKAANLDDADELFLAGLLHDVGRLVLSSALSEEYQQVLASFRDGIDLVTAEEEAFGLNHADITREVLMRLKTPEILVTAASLHAHPIHKLKRASHDVRRAVIVALADRMALALALGDSGDSLLYPLHDAMRAAGLSAEAIGSVARQAACKTSDLELLYTSYGDVKFRESFARELTQQACIFPRLAVLAGDAPNDLFSLLAGRLEWLDPSDPQIAVLYVKSSEEFEGRFRDLCAQESALGTTLAVLLASCDPSVAQLTQRFDNRPCLFVRVPCNYAAFIHALHELEGGRDIPADKCLAAN